MQQVGQTDQSTSKNHYTALVRHQIKHERKITLFDCDFQRMLFHQQTIVLSQHDAISVRLPTL